MIEQAVRLFLRTPSADVPAKPFERVTVGARGRFSKHNLDQAPALFEAEDPERYRNRGWWCSCPCQRPDRRAPRGQPGTRPLRGLATGVDRFVRPIRAVRGGARRLLANREEPEDLRSTDSEGHGDPLLPTACGAAPRDPDRSRATTPGHLRPVVRPDRGAFGNRRLPGSAGHRTGLRVGHDRQR